MFDFLSDNEKEIYNKNYGNNINGNNLYKIDLNGYCQNLWQKKLQILLPYCFRKFEEEGYLTHFDHDTSGILRSNISDSEEESEEEIRDDIDYKDYMINITKNVLYNFLLINFDILVKDYDFEKIPKSLMIPKYKKLNEYKKYLDAYNAYAYFLNVKNIENFKTNFNNLYDDFKEINVKEKYLIDFFKTSFICNQ